MESTTTNHHSNMPNKILENFRVPKAQDKRAKLTKEDREYIFTRYKNGEASQRELAREYSVSRRLIQFIAMPEKLVENHLALKKRGGWKKYYTKEKQRDYMQKHRNHKREILKAIKDQNENIK